MGVCVGVCVWSVEFSHVSQNPPTHPPTQPHPSTHPSSSRYSTRTKSLKNRFAHLTNYSVNKKRENYEKNDNKDADGTGSKWSLPALRRYVNLSCVMR